MNGLNMLPHQGSRIFIAGHTGLVGSALHRAYQAAGFTCLLTPSHAELDLSRQTDVEAFFIAEKPEYVLLAAAKVGGIMANWNEPAPFLYDNLSIEINVLHAAWQHKVKRLLFLGSSCIYPKYAHQPITEDCLLAGELEPTNEAYAIAKIAGVKLCQAYNRQYGTQFIPVMPTNLYGPHDNFDLNTSHVLPALLRKVHEAKLAGENKVVIWGTGTPRREFLHVDDLAEACLFLMHHPAAMTYDLYNVGVGSDVTIMELVETVAQAVGWEGGFMLDPTKPDGAPRKLLDVSRLRRLGWQARIGLADGLRQTYEWYLQRSKP